METAEVETPLHKTGWAYHPTEGDSIIDSRIMFKKNIMYCTVNKAAIGSRYEIEIKFSDLFIKPSTAAGSEVFYKRLKAKDIYLNSTRDTLFLKEFGTNKIFKYVGYGDNFDPEWY